MQPDEIKQWLMEEQWKAYENAIKPGLSLRYKTLIESLEALAASRELSEQRRVLMKKDQYQYFYSREDESEGNYCIGCGMIKGLPHKPDCAWDAALKDVGGE